MSDAKPLSSTPDVRIELLDPSTYAPIQSWEFKDQARITIGRASDQDIAIADLSVSRLHVELIREDEGWRMNALGRHGVSIAGQTVQSTLLGSDATFRLSGTGPLLRFMSCADLDDDSVPVMDAQETMVTMPHQVLTLEDLETQDRDAKVGEIVNSDFFNAIKDKARKLRLRR